MNRAALRFGVLTAVAVLALGITSAAAFAQDDPQQGGVTGVLYADKDRNGEQDSGEAISGGEVTLVGPDSAVHKTTSDADGKFAFAGLAPGTYKPSYALAGGWVVHHAKADGDLITVAEHATTDVVVRAERPYSEQLKVTWAAFDHYLYRHPSSVTTSVTLRNTTDRAISGIQARCDRKNAPGALGHGRGWDVLSGAGVTLAAGEWRSFTIVEEIPEAARAAGKVTLDCDFAPNAGWNTDGPVLHADAQVIPGNGNHTMVVGEDRNGDSRIDADEAVSGVKVVLYDWNNHFGSVEGTSGPDGKVEFTGLEKTNYRAQTRGPWMFAGEVQHVRAADQGGTSHRVVKYVKPADIRAEVKFAKPSFKSHETVQWDLVLTNVGGMDTWVRPSGYFPDLQIPDEQLTGVSVPAGESRTISFSGKIRNYRNGKVTVSGSIDYFDEQNPPVHKQFYGEVDIEQSKGSVSGVVYLDKNHNGRPDPGEAAADAVVEANGGAPYNYYKATTDAEGRYSFNELPTGAYSIGFTLAGGWIVHFPDDVVQHVQVEAGKSVQLVTGAQRPYAEVLKATVQFDKTAYAVGEEVKITVKLTNRGGYVINGVHALCNRNQGDNHLGDRVNPSESWGDLRWHAKGVTVNPGETVTLVVTERVPEAARVANRVELLCEIAPRAEFNRDFAPAYDWANVPGGGNGDVMALVAHDKDGDHVMDPGDVVPHARVRLMSDREHGFLVAEAVGDVWGWVRFTDVPAGMYWATVDGPWKIVEQYRTVGVRAGGSGLYYIGVEPDPGAVQPGDGVQPAGGGTSTGGTKVALARTGASVLGLAFLGALLVAAGAALRRWPASRQS
ncbi:SdrD B-like domain-containing protein [Lentzea rhizosphaerae]|uniref:SdrD B-like domain-containing protein n=1 Tax=Lentzea rhizosphaerae TaxID=2041025 RepID=A0ABV8CBJ3_9PSEU